jgi:pSer/pThr/pTyr-binding forkhead associated (FHA) protein
MATRLVALDGGLDIVLDATPIVVGRHPHCEFRLFSRRVSRRHCCIGVVNGEVEVRDLGSTNGILINCRQTQSGWMRSGNVLSIAHFRYRLEHGPPTRTSWLISLKSSRPS